MVSATRHSRYAGFLADDFPLFEQRGSVSEGSEVILGDTTMNVHRRSGPCHSALGDHCSTGGFQYRAGFTVASCGAAITIVLNSNFLIFCCRFQNLELISPTLRIQVPFWTLILWFFYFCGHEISVFSSSSHAEKTSELGSKSNFAWVVRPLPQKKRCPQLFVFRGYKKP